MAKKSLFITYLLWMFGGIFGLHHFYLGRDFQALIWWMFAGGYFGLGLVRDLWRIPEYVKDANEEKGYMEQLLNKMHKNPPSSGTVRYFGQVTVADAFGYLILGAIPLDFVPQMLLTTLGAILVPIAVATEFCTANALVHFDFHWCLFNRKYWSSRRKICPCTYWSLFHFSTLLHI